MITNNTNPLEPGKKPEAQNINNVNAGAGEVRNPVGTNVSKVSRDTLGAMSKEEPVGNVVDTVKTLLNEGKQINEEKLDALIDFFELVEAEEKDGKCVHLDELKKGNEVFVIDKTKTNLTKISPGSNGLLGSSFMVEKYPIAQYLTEDNPTPKSKLPMQEMMVMAETHPKNAPSPSDSSKLLERISDLIE